MTNKLKEKIEENQLENQKLKKEDVNNNQEEFIAKIDALSHEGRGIAKVDGKTIFLDGALPSEIVTYKVLRNKRKFIDAKVIDIRLKSDIRVNPVCKHADICGGCSLQHVAPSSQIKLKQDILVEQLEHFGNIKNPNLVEPIVGPTTGYRMKARLGVKFVIKKDKVLVGFREKRTSYLAEIDECQVIHPKVGKNIKQIRELIYSIESRDKIAQIEMSVGDNHVALVFRNLCELSEQEQKTLIEFGMSNQIDIYLQPKGPDSVIKIWPFDKTLRLKYTIKDEDLKMSFHPLDFVQINPEINNKMINRALNWLNLNREDIVLDLFCGLGNFTLPIAKQAKYVIGIEGSDEMVKRGYENSKLNNIENVEFHAFDLSKDHLKNPVFKKHKINKVLLDPPRSGALEILPIIANIRPEVIVYVSCNPATLARDAGELVNKYNYKLQKVGVMDMFPHTAHVESIAIFTK